MRPRIALISLALLCACALALLLRVPMADAHQHVANGGFEQGFDGWSLSPNIVASIASAPETAPAEGTASARIELPGGSGVLRYRLDGALASGAYALSLHARSATAGVTVALVLQPDDSGGQLDAGIGDAASSWSQIAGTVTLSQPQQAVVTVIISGPPSASVYVDDVRLDGAPPVTLTPTPPATSTALIGATPVGGSTALAGSPSATPTAVATPTPFVDQIGPALRNSGFEEIDADGALFAWAKYGGVLSAVDGARSGSHAAQLDSATTSTKWLHQAVTVAPGGWYAFDAWVLHADAGVASAFLRVSWYPTGDASGEAIDTADSTETLNTPATGYRYLTTAAIQAPADARSARVRVMLAPNSAAPAAILVDDAWFGAVDAPLAPAPTALAAATSAVAPSGVDGRAPELRSSRGSRDAPSTSRVSRAASGVVGAPSSDAVLINEILYDAVTSIPPPHPGSEPAPTAVPDAEAEWVELYNTSDVAVDVGGWQLRDASAADVLPSLLVPPQGFAIIAASDAFRAAYPDVAAPVAVLGGRIGNALGNDGDGLSLVDPAGRIVDAVSWGDDVSAFDPSVEDVPAGHSIERRVAGVDSDVAGDFIDNERPSPGRAFVAGDSNAKPQIRSGAVELLAGSGARDWDWLPWALAALAGAACAGTLGWRSFWFVRDRARQP